MKRKHSATTQGKPVQGKPAAAANVSAKPRQQPAPAKPQKQQAGKQQKAKPQSMHAPMAFARPMRPLDDSDEDDGGYEARARDRAHAAQFDADNDEDAAMEEQDEDDDDEDAEDDEAEGMEDDEEDEDAEEQDGAAEEDEEEGEDAEDDEEQEDEDDEEDEDDAGDEQELELDLPVQLIQATYSGALYGLKSQSSLRRLLQFQRHLHSKRGLQESDVVVDEDAEDEDNAADENGAAAATAAAGKSSAATPASTTAASAGFSLLFTSQAHIGSVKCLSVAADGRWMVSGGNDESVRVYATARMAEHGSLIHHSGTVTAAQFYGSAFMLSGGSEGALCIWNTKDWSLAKKFETAHRPGEDGSNGGVAALAVHPSGRVALSVGAVDRQVKLWDLMKGTLASSRALDGPPVHSVAWSPSGERYVLLGDRRLDVYAVANNALVRREELNDTKVLSLAFLTDDVILLGCEDKTIRVHSTHTGECITILRGHGARVRGLDVLAVPSSAKDDAPLIHLVGSASTDGQTHLWDLSSLVRAAAASAPETPVLSGHAAAFHPIASKSMDHRVVALRFLPHWRVRKDQRIVPVQTQGAIKKQQEMMQKKQQRQDKQTQEKSAPAAAAAAGKKQVSKADRLAAQERKSKALFEKTQVALLARKKEAQDAKQQKKAQQPKPSFEVAPLERSDDEDDAQQDENDDEAEEEEEEEQEQAPPAKRAKVDKPQQKQTQQAAAKPAPKKQGKGDQASAAAAPTAKAAPSPKAAVSAPKAKAAKAAKPAASAAAADDEDEDDDDAGFQSGLPLFRPQLKQMQRKKNKSQRKIKRDQERNKMMQAR